MELTSHAPKEWLAPYSHAPSMLAMRPVHPKMLGANDFPAFILCKTRTFSQNPGRNSHYKY